MRSLRPTISSIRPNCSIGPIIYFRLITLIGPNSFVCPIRAAPILHMCIYHIIYIYIIYTHTHTYMHTCVHMTHVMCVCTCKCAPAHTCERGWICMRARTQSPHTDCCGARSNATSAAWISRSTNEYLRLRYLPRG